jgi:hypothetical protein
VTQRIVDSLETVQVDHEDGDRFLMARAALDGLVQPRLQQRTVGKTGKCVVVSKVSNRVRKFLALGDVVTNRKISRDFTALSAQHGESHVYGGFYTVLPNIGPLSSVTFARAQGADQRWKAGRHGLAKALTQSNGLGAEFRGVVQQCK